MKDSDFDAINKYLTEAATVSKKKIDSENGNFGNKEYINHEFSKIVLSKDYKPQIKIMGEKSETRWISITKEQLDKIKKILEK